MTLSHTEPRWCSRFSCAGKVGQCFSTQTRIMTRRNRNLREIRENPRDHQEDEREIWKSTRTDSSSNQLLGSSWMWLPVSMYDRVSTHQLFLIASIQVESECQKDSLRSFTCQCMLRQWLPRDGLTWTGIKRAKPLWVDTVTAELEAVLSRWLWCWKNPIN